MFNKALRSGRVLVADGGKGSYLSGFLSEISAHANGLVEELALHREELISGLHREFVISGSEVIITNTFMCNPVYLARCGRLGDEYKLCLLNTRLAVDIRKAVGRSALNRIVYVGGSIGIGREGEECSLEWDQVESGFAEAVKGLLDGGADFIVLETVNSAVMLKTALKAIETVFLDSERSVPVGVHFSPIDEKEFKAGLDMYTHIVSENDIAFCGINCSIGIGSEVFLELLRGALPGMPLSYLPSAIGLTGNNSDKVKMFTEHMVQAIDKYGLALVGGCCGIEPNYIRGLATALR